MIYWNGLIIEWGQDYDASAPRDVYQTFKFPIKYSNNKYSKTEFAQGNNGTKLQLHSIISFDTTSIFVHGFGMKSDTGVYTIGYITQGY